MRSERALLVAALLLGACDEKKTDEAAPARFEGVKKQATQDDHFCEKSYPAEGSGARKFTMPPTRPFGEATKAAPGWKWLNIWATWCTPCVEEMALLGRWRDGLSREGVPVAFELVSVDDADAAGALAGARAKGLPGAVRWLRSQDDLPPLLDALGVDRGAAIPIHALVDPAGRLRCVRVGAIHEQDWAAVKAIVAR